MLRRLILDRFFFAGVLVSFRFSATGGGGGGGDDDAQNVVIPRLNLSSMR